MRMDTDGDVISPSLSIFSNRKGRTAVYGDGTGTGADL